MASDYGPKSYVEQSKRSWWRDGALLNPDLQVGCLQRIADALEKDRGSWDRMVSQRDYQRGRAERLADDLETERRRVAYWKGRARKLAREAQA